MPLPLQPHDVQHGDNKNDDDADMEINAHVFDNFTTDMLTEINALDDADPHMHRDITTIVNYK